MRTVLLVEDHAIVRMGVKLLIEDFLPPVNVVEADASLWVISAIPGVAAERVDVRLDGRELIIAGVRPLPNCCAEGELKIWEIPLGRFERRLRLAPSEQALSVGDISFRDGLLIIELRKHA